MLDELREELNEEAEELLHELNVELPKEIEEAVAHGDLSENSEYEAARERQQFVQARLDYISRRLSELSEMDMDTIPEDRVGFGTQVTVKDLDDGGEEVYTLAMGDLMDLDMDSGEISMESPIGRSLLGCEEGDRVTINTPGGQLRYEVMELETLHDMVDGEERAEEQGAA